MPYDAVDLARALSQPCPVALPGASPSESRARCADAARAGVVVCFEHPRSQEASLERHGSAFDPGTLLAVHVTTTDVEVRNAAWTLLRSRTGGHEAALEGTVAEAQPFRFWLRLIQRLDVGWPRTTAWTYEEIVRIGNVGAGGDVHGGGFLKAPEGKRERKLDRVCTAAMETALVTGPEARRAQVVADQ